MLILSFPSVFGCTADQKGIQGHLARGPTLDHLKLRFHGLFVKTLNELNGLDRPELVRAPSWLVFIVSHYLNEQYT